MCPLHPQRHAQVVPSAFPSALQTPGTTRWLGDLTLDSFTGPSVVTFDRSASLLKIWVMPSFLMTVIRLEVEEMVNLGKNKLANLS